MKKIGKFKKAHLDYLMDYYRTFETGSLRELVKEYRRKSKDEEYNVISGFWKIRELACETVIKDREQNALF